MHFLFELDALKRAFELFYANKTSKTAVCHLLNK